MNIHTLIIIMSIIVICSLNLLVKRVLEEKKIGTLRKVKIFLSQEFHVKNVKYRGKLCKITFK